MTIRPNHCYNTPLCFGGEDNGPLEGMGEVIKVFAFWVRLRIKDLRRVKG